MSPTSDQALSSSFATLVVRNTSRLTWKFELAELPSLSTWYAPSLSTPLAFISRCGGGSVVVCHKSAVFSVSTLCEAPSGAYLIAEVTWILMLEHDRSAKRFVMDVQKSDQPCICTNVFTPFQHYIVYSTIRNSASSSLGTREHTRQSVRSVSDRKEQPGAAYCLALIFFVYLRTRDCAMMTCSSP